MIGGVQWLVATVIAVAIHVLGLLWLSLAPPTRQPQPERSGEGVVVTLGRSAVDAARSATAVKPVEGTVVKAASPSPAPAAVDATPAHQPGLVDLDTVDAGKSVEAQTASTTPPSQSRPVEAAAAKPDRATEVAALEPETASPPISNQTAQPVTAVAVRTQEATDTRPAEAPAEEARLESDNAVPAESVAETPAANQSETIVNDVEIRSARAPAVQAVPAAGESEIESAETESASEAAGVEVTAAREPAPEVEQASTPDISAAEKPQTVDLEKLLQAEEVNSVGSTGGTGVMARYAGVLKGWLQKNMHYPRAARLAGQEGKVVVRFIIDRDGKVRSIKLESRSGFPLLDREAKEMVERGNPFPAIPNEMPGQELEVRVPVSFHVRKDTLTKEIPPIDLQ
jgi:TonB family protein